MNNRTFVLIGCRVLVLHDTHPRAGHDHAVGPCAGDLERVRTGLTASRHDQFIARPHLLFEPDPEPSESPPARPGQPPTTRSALPSTCPSRTVTESRQRDRTVHRGEADGSRPKRPRSGPDRSASPARSAAHRQSPEQTSVRSAKAANYANV